MACSRHALLTQGSVARLGIWLSWTFLGTAQPALKGNLLTWRFCIPHLVKKRRVRLTVAKMGAEEQLRTFSSFSYPSIRPTHPLYFLTPTVEQTLQVNETR